MVFKIRTLSLPKPRTEEDLLIIHGNPLKRFSWRELKVATDNFSSNNLVGRGGYGNVYRGRLPDGSVVAVKRRNKDRDDPDTELEFKAEVEIGSCQASVHRNVIRLRGYCMTRKERLLVYPFMVNRSVASWLRDRVESEPPLDWATRKRIALGAAKGITHLHSGSSFSVIHRDVKPHNILLDDQFEAVLIDFGLAKILGRNSDEHLGWAQRPMEEDDEDPFQEEEEEDSDHDNKYCFTKSCWNLTTTLMFNSKDEEDAKVCATWSCWLFTKNEVKSFDKSGSTGPPMPSSAVHNWGRTEAQANYELCTHTTTRVCGTFGYLDPDYFFTNKVTLKSDVYGYGVVLLELITGKMANDSALLKNGSPVSLGEWVKEHIEDNLDLLVDPNLRTSNINKEMEQLLQLALLCTSINPKDRPVMLEVVKSIENIGKPPRHDQLGGEMGLLVQSFSLPQLKLATNNFSNKNIIGRSGFCKVYRGCLQEDSSMVVVKRLVNRSKRGVLQLRAELKLSGMTTGHPNLLQLRGYCISGKEMMLVYPFMHNKSLEWQLIPQLSIPLDWPIRKKIALGTAYGIAYLHYECTSYTIIRHDVKPSNILLDDDFNPVLSNLRLQSNENQVSTAVCLVKNDVYGYGITLLVLVSGKKVADLNAMATNDHDNSYINDSNLHNWFKNKLRHHQLRLLVDPSIVLGDNNYDTMYIKDEIEQIVQVALLCTQPSPMDRPEMSEVIQMLEGISQGDLKVCFAFDHANLFRFDSIPVQCSQPELQLPHEVELGASLDLPTFDTEGSVCAEFGHINQVQLKSTKVIPKSDPLLDVLSVSKKDTCFSSKGKEVASSSVKPAYLKSHPQTRYWSQSEGISISNNEWEPKMQDRWRVFISEVVSNALPTKSKLFQSGMSADPFCPFCSEYEEDNFHLFFKCGFSKQVWQLAVGVRIDMLGFESVKEAVDVILKPNAGVNIPSGLEPARFSQMGVAVMYSVWTHRNKVCFDKLSPDVMEVVSLSQTHFT